MNRETPNSDFPLPGFLIVGAMKAGTTALYDFLRQCESIHVPEKELHFFNHDDQYRLGIEHYRSQFQTSLPPASPRPLLVGEKTPSYSYVPEVPERIHRDLPGVKIVWIFRDPVHRTYSHYLHAVRAGVEKQRFPRVIRDEMGGKPRPEALRYLDRSIYADQVERYLEYFPAERMHYIRFDEMLATPEAVLGDLADFLEVDRFIPQELPHSNESPELKPAWIPFYAFSLSRFGRRHKLTKFILKKGAAKRKRCQIDSGLESEMREFFRPHNRRIEQLTGFDFSSWD